MGSSGWGRFQMLFVELQVGIWGDGNDKHWVKRPTAKNGREKRRKGLALADIVELTLCHSSYPAILFWEIVMRFFCGGHSSRLCYCCLKPRAFQSNNLPHSLQVDEKFTSIEFIDLGLYRELLHL